MSWNWEVFCKSTLEEDFSPVCFGTGGEITYLDWMLSAWGWTLSVSALGLLVAMILGILMGTLRTLPPDNLLTRSLTTLGNVLKAPVTIPKSIAIIKPKAETDNVHPQADIIQSRYVISPPVPNHTGEKSSSIVLLQNTSQFQDIYIFLYWLKFIFLRTLQLAFR